MKDSIKLTAVVAAALLLAACAKKEAAAPAPAATPEPAATAPVETAPVEMAPAAEGATTDMAAPAGEPVPEGLSDDAERAGGDKVAPN